MLSYHNDQEVKTKYQSRFEAHRKADEVIQGTGFENGRGCFVGCTLDDYNHANFPVELGWPKWLAHWADYVFENLPTEEAAQFGTDLLEAVPVGVDLEIVRHKLTVWRLERRLHLLENNTEEYALKVKDALKQILEYHNNPTHSPERISELQLIAENAAEDVARISGSLTRIGRRSVSLTERSIVSTAYSAVRLAAKSLDTSIELIEDYTSSVYIWAGVATIKEKVAEFKAERDAMLNILRSLTK